LSGPELFIGVSAVRCGHHDDSAANEHDCCANRHVTSNVGTYSTCDSCDFVLCDFYDLRGGSGG